MVLIGALVTAGLAAFVRYEVVFQLAWVAGAFIPSMIPVPFREGILAMAISYAVLAVLYLVRVRRVPDRS